MKLQQMRWVFLAYYSVYNLFFFIEVKEYNTLNYIYIYNNTFRSRLKQRNYDHWLRAFILFRSQYYKFRMGGRVKRMFSDKNDARAFFFQI
jgi:hypothetical protein